MESGDELAHVHEAYRLSGPTCERTAKAHITDDSGPLQMIYRERESRATRRRDRPRAA